MEKNGTVTRTGVSVEESEQVIFDGMNAFERNVKRMGDCALAFLALIVFSPLFLLCYIAVKREDGGPAIFKQERIGRFGRPADEMCIRDRAYCFYQNYREVRLLVIHCSATRYDRDFPVEALRSSHKARGFADIGYHFYITRDGELHRWA